MKTRLIARKGAGALLIAGAASTKSTVPLAEVFDRSGEPRLILITCGGAYHRGTGYTDNVVATALPESSAKS